MTIGPKEGVGAHEPLRNGILALSSDATRQSKHPTNTVVNAFPFHILNNIVVFEERCYSYSHFYIKKIAYTKQF